MTEAKRFWMVSAPKTREDTFNTLNKKTADENDLSLNYKFNVPDLKVGTLDSLMAISDELHKVDSYIEAACRKIASQLFDVASAGENADGTSKKEKPEALTVNNNNVDQYLMYFRWDEAKYPTSSPLKALVEQIHAQVGKLDEELKVKALEYNNILHSLHAEERKAGGNFLTRDLGDVVKPTHVVESEYMQTLFVAVPRPLYKEWQAQYEKLTELVLPRSSDKIDEDAEYGLFRVIVFKKVLEDFKNKCREKKFYVRDFAFDPNKNKAADKKKLELDREKSRKLLIRWCKTNFSEAFIGWTHMKAIRIFVESVLRYGLPTNFQAMLLLPKKGKDSRLRKALMDLYGHLSNKTVFSQIKSDDDDEDPTKEVFYPYVFLDFNLDFDREKP